MAKAVNTKYSKSKKTKPQHFNLSLTKINYLIIGVGILLIVLGYVFMAEKSVDGFMPTVIAPILLVLGYVVAIPIGILFNADMFKKDESFSETVLEDPKGTSNLSSNVKTN
jgi:uncharacterized membrane protein YidH (DUF202 family)